MRTKNWSACSDASSSLLAWLHREWLYKIGNYGVDSQFGLSAQKFLHGSLDTRPPCISGQAGRDSGTEIGNHENYWFLQEALTPFHPTAYGMHNLLQREKVIYKRASTMPGFSEAWAFLSHDLTVYRSRIGFWAQGDNIRIVGVIHSVLDHTAVLYAALRPSIVLADWIWLFGNSQKPLCVLDPIFEMIFLPTAIILRYVCQCSCQKQCRME